MGGEDKLSVVIPIYNAVKTLPKTVESVLAQNMDGLTLWLVDDGSTDGSGHMCDEFAQRDGRVRVIHQKNCGCYQARLNALRRVKSQYIGFVDADDVVEPDMYEKMVNFADANHLDVVQCDYEGDGEIKCGREVFQGRVDVMEHYVYPMIICGRGAAFVWNKIYRNQYDFDSFDETDHVTMYEDLIFNLQFFLAVNSMGMLHEKLYHYNINAGSSVKNFRAKNLADFREAVRIRKKCLPKYGVGLSSVDQNYWIRKNMRNMLITAASAPAGCMAERTRRVKLVVRLSEFPFASLRYIPVAILTLMIFFLKRIHG